MVVVHVYTWRELFPREMRWLQLDCWFAKGSFSVCFFSYGRVIPLTPHEYGKSLFRGVIKFGKLLPAFETSHCYCGQGGQKGNTPLWRRPLEVAIWIMSLTPGVSQREQAVTLRVTAVRPMNRGYKSTSESLWGKWNSERSFILEICRVCPWCAFFHELMKAPFTNAGGVFVEVISAGHRVWHLWTKRWIPGSQ